MPEIPSTAKSFVTSGPYQLLARRIMLPWMLQGERPTGEVLEIGAGSGAMAAQLLAAFPELRMVATDFDNDMVEKARRALAPFGQRARVHQADATQLPFADERFDLVLSAAMLHHTLAWRQAVAEAVRVLRQGGRLVGYDFLDTALPRLMHFGASRRAAHAAHAAPAGSADIQLLARGDMPDELRRLRLTDIRTKIGIGGVVVRFAATKPS